MSCSQAIIQYLLHVPSALVFADHVEGAACSSSLAPLASRDSIVREGRRTLACVRRRSRFCGSIRVECIGVEHALEL